MLIDTFLVPSKHQGDVFLSPSSPTSCRAASRLELAWERRFVRSAQTAKASKRTNARTIATFERIDVFTSASGREKRNVPHWLGPSEDGCHPASGVLTPPRDVLETSVMVIG